MQIENKHTIIEMERISEGLNHPYEFWADPKLQNINIDVLLINSPVREIFEKFMQMAYLPDSKTLLNVIYPDQVEGGNPKESIRLLKDRLRLCYLASRRDFHRRSPFRKKDVEVFQESVKCNRLTRNWFKAAIIPFAIFSGSSYGVFISMTTLDPTIQAALSGSIGFAASVGINLVSLCITGTNPNQSKDADNKKQNIILKVKATYDEMALELMTLNQICPDFARVLALQLDPQEFNSTTVYLNNFLSEEEFKSIFRMFEDAILFLRGEREKPRHHVLARYLNL